MNVLIFAMLVVADCVMIAGGKKKMKPAASFYIFATLLIGTFTLVGYSLTQGLPTHLGQLVLGGHLVQTAVVWLLLFYGKDTPTPTTSLVILTATNFMATVVITLF